MTIKRLLTRLASGIAVMLVCGGLFSLTQSHAAILSWSGGGANAFWDNDANWGFVGTPTNGDTLIFPAGQPNLISTNNIGGLTLSQIRFVGAGGGYDLRGTNFTLTNNIIATNSVGANIIRNGITLATTDQIVNVTVTLTLIGQLSGSVGVIKTGPGTLNYNASSNPYTGTTFVNAGTLVLNCGGFDVAFGGPLVITNATVRLGLDQEIPNSQPITINSGGLLDLNNLNETISGSLVLNGGTISVGTATLSIGTPSTITVGALSGIINGSGIVQLNAGPSAIDVTASFSVTPSIQGSAAITKTGAGNLMFSGANTYSGLTTINAGMLTALNNQALGSTNAGTVVNGTAVLMLNNAHVTNEVLTLDSTNSDGALQNTATAGWTGPIILSTSVYIEASSAFGIDGPISGPGGFVKINGGTLTLKGASTNTYGGTTIVTEGTLALDKIPFDGAIPHNLLIGDIGTVRNLRSDQIADSSTVTITPSATLDLSGNLATNTVLPAPVHSNNSVGNWTLGYSFTPNTNLTVTHVRHYFGNKVSIWTDGGALLATQSVVSVPGTWVETPLSTPLQLTAGSIYRVAAYTGGGGYYWRENLGTNFPNGTINQSYEIGGDAFPNSTDSVRWWFVDFRYTTGSGGDGIASLNGSGTVSLGNSSVTSFGTGAHTYDGVISGSGAFNVAGTNIDYTLNGNNTYTGPTRLLDGAAHTVKINGSQPKSPVYVGDLSILGGSGTVGNITNNGTIAPGSSPGVLTCSNVVINPSRAFAVEVAGLTVGTDYDQLNVRGTCNVTNAALSINLAFANPVAAGQQFTIINNDSAENINGNFAGYGGGATWNQNGYTVVISYVGGSGNDLVLTLTNVPGAVVGSTITAGNGDGVIAANECNDLGIAITNRSGTPMTGITAILASTTPGVIVTESPVPYPTIAGNGKGTNTVPFQISTTPSFVCGSNISLTLTVTSSSHGAFIVPITLPTGTPSVAPVRFDNNTTVNVPDIGTIESTNNVAVWSGGPITKVAVSLWLSAPFDGDLNLTLFAPNGSSVDLSSGNGGAGLHYGTGSADGSRTTFDDGAATSITAGTAPFVGSFRPEVSLANLLGTTPVAGNWRLRINDGGFFGAPDTLRNWSLFLYGTDCGTGSGLCELCPNVTLTSAMGPNSPTQVGYLNVGSASVCGVPKACPGTNSDVDVYPTENFTFRNGPSDACISVTLSNITIGGMAIGAYLGSFNPANPDKCVNYLADPGNYAFTGQSVSFSFDVASNATFVINVLGGSYGEYKLSVTGGDCRPVLNATPLGDNQAVLDWTTAAAGYQLESTNALPGATVWPAITNPPVVVNSRFHVTNTVPPANQFYHLRKPLP